MIKSLPNILTISRILTIPLILIVFYILEASVSAHIIAATLFIIASITDFFDGYIARTWSMQSNLGRFLDPIADKLLVVSCIIMLLDFRKVDIFPALAIVCREIMVSGLREFLADLRVSVPVSKLSKVKTAVQMSAIFVLLLGSIGSGIKYFDQIGNAALWVASFLTLFTGYAYLRSGLNYISKRDK